VNRGIKVFICHKGCGLRALDGARLENYVRLNGGTVLEDPKNADIIIFVACAFTKSKEDESFDLIKELDQYRGKLVVVGCLSEICPTRFKKEFEGTALPSKDLDQIDDFFPSFKIKFKEVPDANVPLPLFGIYKRTDETMPPVIRIANGCLGRCTYCAVRFAVGKLRSKPADY
jgi:tRNA A37 methylthiotransferase MiaB